MKHTIHVHQAKMRKGDPAIIDRTYRATAHSRRLDIHCPHCGHLAATMVQSPTPDRCGARVWIEAQVTAPKEIA